MNIFLAFFVSLVLVQSVANAQVPGQPECLGLTLGQPAVRYATLFEPSGRYYFTCTHWRPANGAILTFGNGEIGVVKTTHEIRGGYFGGLQYDLAIGELEAPVSAKPAGVWWSRQHLEIDEQSVIKGFGPDGWFEGNELIVQEETGFETYDGLWFTSSGSSLIRPGHSGAPVFYKGNLIGINWGYWNGYANGGLVSMISRVLEDYWELFPAFLQPPSEPSLRINRQGSLFWLTIRVPAGANMRIVASSDPCSLPWQPADQASGFDGYVACTPNPWETVIKWNPVSSPRMFFRGEDCVMPE
jgi:hypothetical protein